jgi:hypothetical protein
MKKSRVLWAKVMRVLTTLLFMITLVFMTGCGEKAEPFVDKNMPYEPDTPAPNPHEGVFASEHGTMTFSGDGENVVIDFDKELSEYLELPEGKQEARYFFMTGILPPHGKMPIRYDVAHEFQIIAGEGENRKAVDIEIGEFRDGSFSTGTNCTTADRITFFVDLDKNGDWEAVDFLKIREQNSADIVALN